MSHVATLRGVDPRTPLVPDGENDLLVPPSFDQSSRESIAVLYGVFTHRDGYVSGSVGALASNVSVFEAPLAITASCTKNPALAKKV